MTRVVLFGALLCAVSLPASAQEGPTRSLTLREAVDLALSHNHVVRAAALKVEEQTHVKEIARSAYFPLIRNDSVATHVSDTQLVEIPAGGFGIVGGSLIPSKPLTLNQGGQTFVTSGFGVSQPIVQLLKVRAANDVASADVDAARGKARAVENDISLKVHQLYYRILVAESRRNAMVAKIEASEALQRERVQQVSFGSALNADLLESRAQSVQAKHDLLSTELEISDLQMRFNDVIGVPLATRPVLTSTTEVPADVCARDECAQLARDLHPEVAEARATVQKAEAAVRLTRFEFLPDVEAFARYSLQNNVPFLATHFGTVGVHASYDFFDGGRKRAALRASQTALAQAQENLARVRDEVEVRVQTALNKLERTRQMLDVSNELLALREESRRVVAEQVSRGAALRSSAGATVAQELEARTLLMQARLDYVQAGDELAEAVGRTLR